MHPPTAVHCTTHVPLHVTLHALVDAQVTSLFAATRKSHVAALEHCKRDETPAVTEQVCRLVHVAWQLAPQVASQRTVLEHASVHRSPQTCVHCAPLVHAQPPGLQLHAAGESPRQGGAHCAEKSAASTRAASASRMRFD